MLALAGIVQGDSVVLQNDSVRNYDGKEVILIILDETVMKTRKKNDGDSYGYATELGKNADNPLK